ncbi:MAG: hypothetical protein RBT60_05140 [Candidatus Krumholzibacteria bacterium]|nr:hypothetical protein [Candidatus Krumholzibacteria bacterium]
MARQRRRASRSWQAVRRLEAVLAAARGRGRDHFDRRDPERGPRPRLLDLQRHARLFDRLAALDYEYLLSLDFAAGPDTLRLLLPQSVLGRAQNGHGFWRDEAGQPLIFRDATFDRVLAALASLDSGLGAAVVRRERNLRLQRLQNWLLREMFAPEMLLDDDGVPPLGIELLRGRRVDTRGFLRGLVMAGWMDDLAQRRACMSFYRRTFTGQTLEIGGGQMFVVRPDLLAAVGIVDPGAAVFAPEDIARLVELGIIATEDRTYERPEHEQVYFRLRAGEGVCDDLALIFIGARHGEGAFLGAFVMDAVDTYDKFLWTFAPGGVDGKLAKLLQARWRERYGEPLVTGEDILEVIRLGAKLNDPPCLLSSSHRRFLQTEQGSNVPTLLNHWRFVAGKPIYEIELGYQRFPASEFYSIAYNRLQYVDIKIMPPAFYGRPGR